MDYEIVSKVAAHIAQRLRVVKPNTWVWLDSKPEVFTLVCQQISELAGSIKIIAPPEFKGLVESIVLAGNDDQTLQQLCAEVSGPIVYCLRSAQLGVNRLRLTELDELIVLAEQDTNTLLMNAAGQGLFAEQQPWRYPETGSDFRFTLTVFKQHARQIRLAQADDLPALLALEQQCWLPELQATQQQLAFRLSVYPDGQLVLVHNGQLVGVIYSQRLAQVDTVYHITAEQACEEHNAEGPVLHLLAINIAPAYQHAGFGDALLEFALQRASVTAGITEVIAVTLCRDYDSRYEPDLSLYIQQRNPQGRLADPVLRFHELHGARVTGLVPGYRPNDAKNLAYGVLVRYQIHERRRDEFKPEASSKTPTMTLAELNNTVMQAIQACLGETRLAAFAPNQPLLMMGLDSADLLQLAERLSNAFQLTLEQGFFFQYTTSEKIAQALFKRLEQMCVSVTATQRQEPHTDDIAIIGLSGCYPKADDVQAFWQNLKTGVDAISEVPVTRWDYRHEQTSRYGGFISDVDAFDPLFFNISPSEAETIDPQERLFLQTAWHTIEDAGYNRSSLQQVFQGNIGVFVGAMYGEYSLFAEAQHVMPFVFYGSIANRVSYTLDLHGPSLAIDTLCSSSLTALHYAVHSLRRGECLAALVGGVSLSLHPNKYRLHKQLSMSASDGRCRSFGVDGDGFVPGEGVGAVLLKPLTHAERDGDAIYAVIKATTINHDGKTHGYTVPNPNAQAKLIADAFKQANINPSALSYIEAHGTGTALGDPVEVTGWTKAFQQLGQQPEQCGLGSVKSNIGHLEAAAGIAGLTKIILQLQHQQIVPTLHSAATNPNINFGATPFYLPQRLTPWTRPVLNGLEYPRIACLSSFGAGGANAHAVLTEYLAPPVTAPTQQDNRPVCIVLSAERVEALTLIAQALLTTVSNPVWQAQPQHSLRNVAYTLQMGREALTYRLGFISTSFAQLIQQLTDYLAGTRQLSDMATAASDYQVLKTWLAGQYVDWSAYYQAQPAQRLNLPGYPFAKQRYWLSASSSHGLAHPLLQSNTADESGLGFLAELTGHEPFLRDHQLQGKKILPATAFIEMALAAFKQVLGENKDQGFVLTELIWAKPFKLDDAVKVLVLKCSVIGNTSVRFQALDQENAEHDAAIYCQGRVGIASGVPSVKPSKPALNGLAIDGAKFYQAIRSLGYEYGPTHQGIQQMIIGDDTVWAELELSEIDERFLLSPSLLDAVLQTSLGLIPGFSSWLLAHDTQPKPLLVVPFKLAELVWYAPLPKRVSVITRLHNPDEPTALCFNIEVYDELQQLCLLVNDFCLSPAKLALTKPKFSLVSPEWREQALPATVKPVIYQQHLVVLFDELSVLTTGLTERQPGISWHVLIATETELARRYHEWVLGLITVLKAWLSTPSDGLRIVQVVVKTQLSGIEWGLAGLLLSIVKEYSGLSVQMIGLDRIPSHDELLECVQANAMCPDDVKVSYSQKQRFTQTWHRVNTTTAPVPLPWRQNGVYLITGGLGGLAMIFANAVASAVSSVTLVLIGRSMELKPEQQQQLGALTALGAKVIYRPIDVCSSHQLSNLIRWLDKAHGGLQGVIHSAGVLRDSLLVNKTEAHIRDVLAPKVQGLLALDHATRHCELDFFVVFSSEVSVTGNIGQSDYAAANGFCDVFCAVRQQLTQSQQRHGVSLAINWPYWHEGGMRIQQDLMPNAVLATEDGIAAFYQSLTLGVSQLWLVSEQAAPSETTALRLEHAVVNSDISTLLQHTIAAVLKINPAELNPDTLLSRYGFDSIRMTECLLRLQRDYQLNLAPTVFIDYPTLAQLSAYLSGHLSTQAAVKPKAVLAPASPGYINNSDIAIIGLSGQFPGADDLEQFWRNILQGVHAVTEIPADRWDWCTAYQGQPGNRWGGFLTDIYSFDALFFGISGRDAGYLDPQTRLLLMHSWWALENAGIKPEAFAAQPSGVFIAAAHGEYAQLTEALLQQPEDFTAQFASSLPNRIAQFFDLTGPCEVYEAACASSILALHKAIQAIHQGECSQALVGAVNLLQSPLRYLASDKLGYLSPDGEAKSFQAGANGFVRAEGVAVLVIKPLAQALADQDIVYAVIKGTGIAHGGKGLSLIAPNPVGMTQAMLKAYNSAKVDMATLGYIEAHGIASPLSDAQELYALADGYQQHLQQTGQSLTNPATITLSSLKPSIGHTEIASGLASMIKVVYALRHKIRPGIARFTQVHEQIALTQTPFSINADSQPWPEPVAATGETQLRTASVSSYGDAGVNGHVVLQEFLAIEQLETVSGWHLILVSAKTDTALTAYLHKLAGFINTQSPRIADVALTLQAGRTAMRYRFAVVVESITELQTAINAYLNPALAIEKRGFGFTGIATQQTQAMPDLNGLAQHAYLSALAQHWVQGYPIALTDLYSAQQAKRIPLPGYAFDLQPYRLDVGYAVRTFGQGGGLEHDDMVRVAYPTAETSNLEDYLRQLLTQLLAVSESTLLNAASLHELGLTSLHAVSVKTKLEQYLNKAIPLSALNVFIPFAELARQLTALTEAETTVQASLPVLSIDTLNASQPFPLTDIQQAFWLGRQISEAGQPVGCHAYLELTFKRLDLTRLQQAWQRVLNRHGMLSAEFLADGRQFIPAQAKTYTIAVTEKLGLALTEQTEWLTQVRAELSHYCYHPERWPLFTLRVSRFENHDVLHVSIDELIVDAWSMEQVFSEWSALYANPELTLPPLTVSFRDYVLALTAFDNHSRYQQDLQYWLTKLSPLKPGPVLPKASEWTGLHHCQRLSHCLASEHYAQLKQVAADWAVSPTALVLTLFIRVLQQYSQQPEFTLVLTYFNRLALHEQVNELIAPMISTALFVAEVGSDSLQQHAQRVHAHLLADFDHLTVSGVRVLRELKRQKHCSNDFSLPVVFTSLLGQPVNRAPEHFLQQQTYAVTQTPQVYLDCQVYDINSELQISFDAVVAYYQTGLLEHVFADVIHGLQTLKMPNLSEVPTLTIIRADSAASFPLTELQQAYAFGKTAYGGGVSTQVYSALRVKHLDLARLQAALAKLIANHVMLRAVIGLEGQQKILASVPDYRIAIADLRLAEPEQQQAAIAKIERDMLMRNCPLGDWPHFELRVSLLDHEDALIHFSIELLIADALSLEILRSDLCRFYQQPEAQITPRDLSYADYCLSVKHYEQALKFQHSQRYWQQKFASLPSGLKLPRLSSGDHTGTVRLDAVLTEWPKIKQYAERLHVPPSVVLLTAYAQVLASWSEGQAFSIVIPSWQRLPIHPDINQVVGDFTRLAWLPVNPQQTLSFTEHVLAVHAELQRDFAEAPASGLSVLRKQALKPGQRRALTFPIVFTDLVPDHNYPLPAEFSLTKTLSRTAHVDIDNISTDHGDTLGLHWDVAEAVYAVADVELMFKEYWGVLVGLVDGVV